MGRKIISCLKNNFYHLIHSVNIWVLIGYLFIWSDITARGIRLFCGSVDEKATCYLFPLLMDSSYFSMLFLLGIFILFLDCPFLSRISDYEIPKLGRKIWLTGQFGYMMGASIFYVMAANIICNLLLFPNITISNEWGRVFHTILKTSARTQFDIRLDGNSSVLSRFSAVGGWVLQVSVTIGVCFTLGSVLFTVGLWIGRKISVIVVGLIILYPIILETGFNSNVYYFSPGSWVQLGKINDGTNGLLPSPSFIFTVLIAINILLYLFNLIKISKLEWTSKREENDNV